MSAERLRVLLVEDDEDDYVLTRDLLAEAEGAGFALAWARTFREGLEAVTREPFDAVLLDYRLGEHTGLDFLGRIPLETAAPPVILLTGQGDHATDVAAMRAGAADYLVKGEISARLLERSIRYAVERVRAQEALRLRDRAIAAVTEGILITDPHRPDNPVIYANPGFERLTGWPAAEAMGRNCRFLQGPGTDPAAVDALRAALAESRSCRVELVNYRKDGTPFWNELSITPVRGDTGALTHFVGVLKDVSERRAAEEALRRSEARYHQIASNVPGMVCQLERCPGGAVAWTFASERAREIFGVDPAALQADAALPLALVHPDDRAPLLASLQEAAARGGAWEWEGRIVLPTGEEKFVHGAARPEPREGGGMLWDGLLLDVTERRRAEEALKLSEQRMLQAQKFDAVGRLAGGVAHDFNNLLTAIRGNAELLLMDTPEGDPAREDLEEIRRAADRAASLTRQLLAFSRKQVLQPRVLELNGVVSEMEKMLRRVLGEDVELETRLDRALARVMADPGQLEQVLLNLAVNARDAMPRGGRMVVETRNVRLDEETRKTFPYVVPGDYVLLAVRDTGEGMDPATLERAFDPFFTTKPLGRGTGLGLSTVYGIVKQSGGYIWIDSAPDAGTEVRIYLPPAAPEPSASGEGGRAAPGRGTGTVLLVEDEETVRRLARRVLERSGYSVLEASDGEVALRVAAAHEGTIHLLLTDVVMPRMGGRELAARLLETRPGVRVLYVSGYNEEAVARHGVLDPGAGFIQKPFAPDDLTRKVRELLDAPAGSPAGR